jgi:hypothetical protein
MLPRRAAVDDDRIKPTAIRFGELSPQFLLSSPELEPLRSIRESSE